MRGRDRIELRPIGSAGHSAAVNTPQRPLKILYVAEAFGGGVFELIRVLASRASSEGHAVAIAYGVRPETPERPADHIAPGVTLVRMPWTTRTLRAQLLTARNLRHFVTSWNPDVVHLYSSFAGVVGVIVVSGRLPTVYSPQGYAFTITSSSALRRRVYRLVERFVSRRVTVVGAASESEGAQARNGLRARRIEVVANGIPELDADVPARRPSRREGRPIIVGMGRLGTQRRPGACARIMEPLRDVADLRWIGGAGYDGTGDAELLMEAGITVTGWLDRERVMEQLADATAYLHWTAWDGLPLSVLEALAQDVVVIASDIPVNREVLGEQQTFANEEDATRALRNIIEDRDFRESLLARQRRSRARWSSARMTREWLELYERLAGERSGASAAKAAHTRSSSER